MGVRLFLVGILIASLPGSECSADESPALNDEFFELPCPGPTERPILGVLVAPADQPRSSGPVVHRVLADSAAASLGIEPGDVITRLAGRPIHDLYDLREIVLTREVGEQLDVDVQRAGRPLALGAARLRPWPEAIPYHPLPPLQERGRDRRQEWNLSRSLRQLDRLADHADAVQRQLEELRAEPSELASWRYRVTFSVSQR